MQEQEREMLFRQEQAKQVTNPFYFKTENTSTVPREWYFKDNF
jgi:hypothetical protein